MDQKYLSEIRARERVATPGPWATGNGGKESGFNGRNVVVAIKDGQPYVVMERAIYPKETKFNKQVLADMKFAAHARTDIPALIAEVERLTAENEQNAAYADIYEDICDKYGKNFRALLDKAKALQTENATLKKALELACEEISDYALPSGTGRMKSVLITARIEKFMNHAKQVQEQEAEK
jgi:hypothetical protein